MSRLRLALLAGVVAAFSAFATAAAAQAHEFKVEGVGITTSHSIAGKETGQVQELSGTPFGVAVHINCKKVEVTSGSIEPAGLGKATLSYTECTATKPANCTVKTPIVAKVKTALVENAGVLENEFKPETGEEFTTITLEGASCALKEPFTVTGSQLCSLPGHENELVQHELVCTTAGSKLKAGGKPATYKGGITELHLTTLEKWSAI